MSAVPPRRSRASALASPPAAQPASGRARHCQRVWPALAALVLVAGCATPPTAKPPPAATAAAPATAGAAGAGGTAVAPATPAPAAPATPAAAPSPPSALRPFADIVRDAQRIDGFVPLWRKDERVWLEIAPERLGQPLLLTVNISHAVGERGLFASQMGPAWLVELRRVGNQLQFIARNTRFRADADPALRHAVEQGFSDSLVAHAAVLSAPHPERRSVLVDAAFLLADLAGYSTALERAFRLPFALDRANSSFESVRADAQISVLHTRLHFTTPRIPAPPAVAPPPGAAVPTPPQFTPDPRSLFIGAVVSLRALPAQPKPPRRADPRVGHFQTVFTDYSTDFAADPRVRLIERWRLEKQDPQAAVSLPVQPIVFWIDRNVPQRYRAAVEAGVLEWNRAFERIGFRNALVVRQQPDDAAFDTMDAAHASIRWMLGVGAHFARGPSHVDPRSGEILDADIVIGDAFGRGARRVLVEQVGPPPGSEERLALLSQQWRGGARPQPCTFAAELAADKTFAVELLSARGEIEPDGPEAEALAQAVVRATVAHEVGHVLGLTHNFRASTTVAQQRLRDPEWTREHGISGSIMEYNPFNLPLYGEPRAELVQLGLGPYDYWAIEYAYRPLPAEGQAQALAAIAARSASDAALAFADDFDAAGPDPRVNRWDLGDDPLAFFERRFALSRELWQRVQARAPRPGDDPLRPRRSLLSGFGQLHDLPLLAARQIGGLYAERDLPGEGRPAFRPVDPARQRQALALLTDTLFDVDSFRFRPEFLASLPPDFAEFGPGRGGPVSVPAAVLRLQTGVLDRLFDPGVAQRLLELPLFLDAAGRRGAFSLHELYGTLQGAVWRELRIGGDIERLRRDLQREHLRRVQAVLTRPVGLPADALSLLRLQAVALQRELRRAAARPAGRSVEARAHLADSLAQLDAALAATLLRQP